MIWSSPQPSLYLAGQFSGETKFPSGETSSHDYFIEGGGGEAQWANSGGGVIIFYLELQPVQTPIPTQELPPGTTINHPNNCPQSFNIKSSCLVKGQESPIEGLNWIEFNFQSTDDH